MYLDRGGGLTTVYIVENSPNSILTEGEALVSVALLVGASFCKPKCHQFDSQSGHMPVLWARSPVGSMQEASTH